MSEETNCKRGCPTEDGWYVLKTAIWKEDVLRERINGKFATGLHDLNVLAYRKHVPLEVPPLREVSKCEGVPCVVRYSAGPPLFAVRYKMSDGQHMLVMHSRGSLWPTLAVEECNALTELTKEQCIAEGYRWPLED